MPHILIEYTAGLGGTTFEDLIIKTILEKAIIDKDPQIIKELWQQLDGKPLQRTEISGANGENVGIVMLPIRKNSDISQKDTEKSP